MAVIPVDPELARVRRVAPPVLLHAPHPRAPRVASLDAYGGAVGDAVDGAVAVLGVAAALVRYAAETAAVRRRSVLARLPFTGQLPVLRHALHGPLARLLAHPATAAVQAVSVAADALVPE